MGPSARTLSVAQIEAIAQDEFYNCLSTLGKIEGWSAEQGGALLDMVKTVIARLLINPITMFLQPDQ